MGDVLTIDKVAVAAGESIELQPLLLVDGSTVTSDAGKLAKVTVKAEVVKAAKARRSPSSSTKTRPATASGRATVSR